MIQNPIRGNSVHALVRDRICQVNISLQSGERGDEVHWCHYPFSLSTRREAEFNSARWNNLARDRSTMSSLHRTYPSLTSSPSFPPFLFFIGHFCHLLDQFLLNGPGTVGSIHFYSEHRRISHVCSIRYSDDTLHNSFFNTLAARGITLGKATRLFNSIDCRGGHRRLANASRLV